MQSHFHLKDWLISLYSIDGVASFSRWSLCNLLGLLRTFLSFQTWLAWTTTCVASISTPPVVRPQVVVAGHHEWLQTVWGGFSSCSSDIVGACPWSIFFHMALWWTNHRAAMAKNKDSWIWLFEIFLFFCVQHKDLANFMNGNAACPRRCFKQQRFHSSLKNLILSLSAFRPARVILHWNFGSTRHFSTKFVQTAILSRCAKLFQHSYYFHFNIHIHDFVQV